MNIYYICAHPVFPLSRFLSANQRLVGLRGNDFWLCGKRLNIALEKSIKL